MFSWLRRRWMKRIQQDLPNERVVDIIKPPGRILLVRRQWGKSANDTPFSGVDVIFVPKNGKAVELVLGVESDLDETL